MGHSAQENNIGIKMAGGYWDNPKNHGLPSGLAMFCLFDAANGAPLCILDGMCVAIGSDCMDTWKRPPRLSTPHV